MSLYTPPSHPTFAQPSPIAAQDLAALHIYCLDIRQLSAQAYVEAETMMSASEQARAASFVRGKAGYIASRWLLRKVLGAHLAVAPEAVVFARSDKGKPYLPGQALQFSLSHCEHWALLAVGYAESIGVDVESLKRSRNLNAIAERYYHPSEFAQLQQLGADGQTSYFYRLWTLKEAFFKALGSGISTGLEKITFGVEGEKIQGAIHGTIQETIRGTMDKSLIDNTDAAGAAWHFFQWALSDDHYVALACKSPMPPDVHWHKLAGAPAFP
jgi:4'-phosphopantetheinyl transferase